MITEIQNEFKRTGNYVNTFDEFGNIVIIDNTEKYFAVTFSPETYTAESVNNIYDITIKEFKDSLRPVNPQVNVLQSEKQQLETIINSLNQQLASVNVNDSEKQSLIDASKNVIIQLRIKAGEGKNVSDFNTSFPYLALKSEQAIQSDSSSQGLGSNSTITNVGSNTSTSTPPESKNTNPALTGVVPSNNQCKTQADIQLVPETNIAVKVPLPPTPPAPVVVPAQPLPISKKAVVIATTPPPTVVALKQVEVQTVKCGGRVSNQSLAKGRYVVYVDLGTAVGDVTFNSDALGVPDRFIVEWDNNVVIDTGYRGDASLFSIELRMSLEESGLPAAKILGTGSSTFTFEKTKPTPSVATVTVMCPISLTAWFFTMGCPIPKKDPIVQQITELNNGGGGGCPAAWQLIQTKELGIVEAKHIKVGMHLRDSEPNTWNRVNVAYLQTAPIYRIDIGGEVFDVDHSHQWYVGNDQWKKVTDLKVGDYVESSDNRKVVVNNVTLLGDGEYMHMNVDRERYIMGTNIIGHNASQTEFLARKR